MKTRAQEPKQPSEKEQQQRAMIKKPAAAAKKRTAAADSGKPKKPPTAFFYYLEDFKKTFRKENPDVKSMRDIGKACGDKWRTMSFEEKVQYYDIATEKRADFEKAMAAYLKKKENAVVSEESDDYE